MTKCRAATIAPTRRWKAKSAFWVPGPANGGPDEGLLVAPPLRGDADAGRRGPCRGRVGRAFAATARGLTEY
jgi:hypothetical protein